MFLHWKKSSITLPLTLRMDWEFSLLPSTTKISRFIAGLNILNLFFTLLSLLLLLLLLLSPSSLSHINIPRVFILASSPKSWKEELSIPIPIPPPPIIPYRAHMGGSDCVLSIWFTPRLNPNIGANPAPEILRSIWEASSEGRLFWKYSSWGLARCWGLWAGE